MSGFEPRSSVNCAITAAKIKLFRHLNVETSLNKDRCCSSVTSHFCVLKKLKRCRRRWAAAASTGANFEVGRGAEREIF